MTKTADIGSKRLIAWLWASRTTHQQVEDLRLQLLDAQTQATVAEEKRQWLENAL